MPDPIVFLPQRKTKSIPKPVNLGKGSNRQRLNEQMEKEIPVVRRRAPPPPFNPMVLPQNIRNEVSQVRIPALESGKEEEVPIRVKGLNGSGGCNIKKIQEEVEVPKIDKVDRIDRIKRKPKMIFSQCTKEIGLTISEAGLVSCSLCETKTVENLQICRFCSYNACLRCWDKWIPSNKSCPNCRKSITSEDLTKNRLAIELGSILSQNIPSEEPLEISYICTHDDSPAAIFCKSCDEHLCIDCLSNGTHKGHTLLDSQECGKRKEANLKTKELEILLENAVKCAEKIKHEHTDLYTASLKAHEEAEERVISQMVALLKETLEKDRENIQKNYRTRDSEITSEISNLLKFKDSLGFLAGVEISSQNYEDTLFLIKRIQKKMQESTFKKIFGYNSDLPSKYLFELYDYNGQVKQDLQVDQIVIRGVQNQLGRLQDEYKQSMHFNDNLRR